MVQQSLTKSIVVVSDGIKEGCAMLDISVLSLFPEIILIVQAGHLQPLGICWYLRKAKHTSIIYGGRARRSI